MLTTKSDKVLPMAGLLTAALITVASPAAARREMPQASDERAAAASSAAIAATAAMGPDGIRTAFERLPEQELKSLYRRCNAEALASRLAGAEIALCAVAYDVLLKQHFRGEFEALLAWSRRF